MKIRPVGAEMVHVGGREDGHGEVNTVKVAYYNRG